MAIPVVTLDLKPCRSTRTVYSPTGSEGIVKSPVEVLTVADGVFVVT